MAKGKSGLAKTASMPTPAPAPAPAPAPTPAPAPAPAPTATPAPRRSRPITSSAPTPAAAPAPAPAPTPAPAANPVNNSVPTAANTPVTPNAAAQFKKMSDAQLAQFYKQSQSVSMPNHLNDVHDVTQKFIFAAGMNSKPMVLDSTSFNQFLKQNGISRSEILSRSFNSGQLKTSAGGSTTLTPKDIADMLKYSRLNYIGGKIGGQAIGAGTYLDMNGGSRTGYGGYTVNAVLNPKTAKVISPSQLRAKARAFDRSHPQFARATGGYNENFYNNNMSIYATILGYNVIGSKGGYHNVIDRVALVYEQ